MNSHQTESPRGNILVVDDKPDNLRLLSVMLMEQGYKVRSAINGQMALKAAQSTPPDLILLDINMPQMNGYEVCRQLKNHHQTRDIPVIFLSALDEIIDKIKAFAVGGLDYITKPFQLQEVLMRVENQLAIDAAKTEIRRLNTELEQRVQLRTTQLEAANLELRKEIGERKKAQEQILHMALHDALTGLPNRVAFMGKLGQALTRIAQDPNYSFAVLLLDCDRFKVINSSLGHIIGDQLLMEIANRLSTCLPAGAIMARLGGDEFIVMLEDIDNTDDMVGVTRSLQQTLNAPFHLGEHEVFVNVSAGIVPGNRDYEQPEHVLRDADTAMYSAKTLGKAHYQVFDPGMHQRALELLQLESDLQRAVEREEFLVYYQPIVALGTGKIASFEALARWRHPERGMINPGHFIPAAEETGLIIPIGTGILRQACRQFHHWQTRGLIGPAQTLSVNLSMKQFAQPDLAAQVTQILAQTSLNNDSLRLEITESAIIDNDQQALINLRQLKANRIQLSLDDFGTGYSSLSYLHRFPVDTLKIDRSFISAIDKNADNLEIVQAIVSLAHSLGMSVTAEGIETAEQLDRLRTMACETGQGYLFSKPLDNRSTEALIASNPRW